MSPPCTPIRSSRDRAKPTNTPTQAKHAVTESAIFNGLDRGRDAVISDTGPAIPRVPLAYFFDYLLPPLRSGLRRSKTIEAIQHHLKAQEKIVDGRWVGFEKDPEASGKGEDETFKPFANLGEYIVTASTLR